MQAYSQPKRQSDPYALPDLEVWEEPLVLVSCPSCGDSEIGEQSVEYAPNYSRQEGKVWCPSCEHHKATFQGKLDRTGWFWWSCFPGCLPDGPPNGPFTTEAEALADARDGLEEEAKS